VKPSQIALTIGVASLATGAAAADLGPFFAPPDYAPPPLGIHTAGRWEGMHIGVNGGGFYSPSSGESIGWFPPAPYMSTAGIPNSMSMKQSGVLGGAQIGYAKQWGGFVLGAETDYDMVGSKSSQTVVDPSYAGVGYSFSETQSLRSLGTIRANVGFAPINDLLIYATGGLAFGFASLNSGLGFGNGVTYTGADTNMLVGYAVGGGVEYAIDSQWSIGLQGLYYDLGKSTVVGAPNVLFPADEISPETNSTADFKGFTLRLTANYEFGGESAPVIFPNSSPPEIAATVGARAGMSVSQNRMSLYDGTGSVLMSRLTYHDTQAAIGEIFGRLDDNSGLFAKGFAGIGRLYDGTLQDEDFPPGVSPYSSTDSTQRYGELGYGVADVGYYGFTQPYYRVGGLMGATFISEQLNASGCVQTATNPDVCTPAGFVASSNSSITDSNVWWGARLGLVGEASLPGGFTVRGEAVWLPFITFSGENYHYLRIPQDFSGPIPESATGHLGYQLEGEIDYALAHNFTIGVGARYWSLDAKGDVNFQDAAAGGESQVGTFSTQIFQAYAQTAYRF
jgi:outer membrane immunogenic protein